MQLMVSRAATCLLKPNGGIRPIAVQETTTRLLSRLVMSIYLMKLKPNLSHQYGIKESSAIHNIPNAIRTFVNAFPTSVVLSLTLLTPLVLFHATRSSTPSRPTRPMPSPTTSFWSTEPPTGSQRAKTFQSKCPVVFCGSSFVSFLCAVLSPALKLQLLI